MRVTCHVSRERALACVAYPSFPPHTHTSLSALHLAGLQPLEGVGAEGGEVLAVENPQAGEEALAQAVVPPGGRQAVGPDQQEGERGSKRGRE